MTKNRSEKLRIKTLNKLVDYLLEDNIIDFMNILIHLYYKRFNPQYFPDPKINDPIKYACAAAIAKRMCEVWSSPPKNIKSISPSWCDNVTPLQETLWLVDKDNIIKNKTFAYFGIMVYDQFMFFV